MIFLANRANLNRRTLHTRIKNRLQTQATKPDSPIRNVRFDRSRTTKMGVRATVDPASFLDRQYPVDAAELQVSFDFPDNSSFDYYAIQWVEAARDVMIGWHQDDTHGDLGECHFQLDYAGRTIQREPATVLDEHPLNVFEQRTAALPAVLDAIDWSSADPRIPADVVR